jgi:hypothetical protein
VLVKNMVFVFISLTGEHCLILPFSCIGMRVTGQTPVGSNKSVRNRFVPLGYIANCCGHATSSIRRAAFLR